MKGYVFLPRPAKALTFGELARGERFVFLLLNGEVAPESGNPAYQGPVRRKVGDRQYSVTWADGAVTTMRVSPHAIVRREA